VTSAATTLLPAPADPDPEPIPPVDAGVPDVVRRRLVPGLPGDRWTSWAATGVVVLVAAILRLVGLSHPTEKVFDEVYYASEGHDLLVHGVEWNATNNNGDFVVHPPLGKWIIGLGEWIFHYNSFGWRIMPAIFGIISVLILTRTARRLFRSTLLGCAAGLLMSLDGMHLVLSRSALLDIFLMFFVLAAFACLVMDRDQRRARWLRALEAGLDPGTGGRAGRVRFSFPGGVPWWRLAAAVMTGCAMSVKWSALWYIILFVVLIYLWEAGARRSAGVVHRWRDTLLDETGWVVAFLVILGLVYLVSWSGWFLTDTGFDRHWLQAHNQGEPPIIGPLVNLYHYHKDALYFHDHLTTKHTYQSWPWQWLLLGRPVAFYWSSSGPCGSGQCAGEILLLGTPLLWWSFLPALVGTAWFGISRRDWRALAIGLGALAGILPWFKWELDDRTMFYFYALPAEPFLVLTVVYVLGCLMASPASAAALRSPAARRRFDPSDRRLYGAVAVGAYLVLIAFCFAYFYPIYVGNTLDYSAWFHRMWLGSRWI
jgi:dolichyl-phosphate-mannose-protein mannosyltransferase